MAKHAVFLEGPIGAGKTTLGRALAAALDGAFIDGDDHSDPGRPWYSSILRTSRAIVAEGLKQLERRDLLVVAYPLGCSSWIFYRRRFGDAGVRPLFVGLRASYAAITAAHRGRVFTPAEQARIRVMIAEGYGERPFSDLVVDTDAESFDRTLLRLVEQVRGLMAHPEED